MTAGDVGRMVTVMGPTVTVMGRIVTAMGRIVMSWMVAMRRCGWMAVRILPSASALSAGFWTLRLGPVKGAVGQSWRIICS